jgi:hypothetical protein
MAVQATLPVVSGDQRARIDLEEDGGDCKVDRKDGAACQIAFHRLAEGSMGIEVALILAAARPEMEAVATEKK